jgi:hypothetical protein
MINSQEGDCEYTRLKIRPRENSAAVSAPFDPDLFVCLERRAEQMTGGGNSETW